MCQAFYVNDYARWSMNSHFSKYSIFLSEAKLIEPFFIDICNQMDFDVLEQIHSLGKG